MKKILSVFAMMAMLFVACTPEDQPGTGNENEGGNNNENGGGNTEQEAPELKITSNSSFDFSAEGGSESISYLIINPVAGISVTAECEADWVTDLTPGETRTTFKVSAYESTEAPRSTKIVLSYGEAAPVEVTVTQQPAVVEADPDQPDVEFTATTLYGKYYGSMYGTEGYNYYIILTDSRCGMNAQDQLLVDVGTYYILDVYSEVAVGEGESILPLGTYEFDATSTGASGTIAASASAYLEVVEAVDQKEFTSATLTVTEGKVELIAVVDNKTHKVTFEGSLLLTPPEGSGNQGGEGPMSNLTEDVIVMAEDAMFLITNYGDYYETGTDNWTIECLTDNSYLSFETLNPIGAGFAGEYPSFYTDDYDGTTNTMLSLYDGAEMGSMFASITMTEDGPTIDGEKLAPIVEGEMIIEFDPETSECTLEFDGYDDAGYSIVAIVSGVAMVEDDTQAASLQKKRSAVKSTKTLRTSGKPTTFALAK